MSSFHTSETVRARIRVYGIDPVDGSRAPEEGRSDVLITFRSPEGEVYAELDAVEAGEGWYYADAVPEEVGLHEVEFAVGDSDAKEVRSFAVRPFA